MSKNHYSYPVPSKYQNMDYFQPPPEIEIFSFSTRGPVTVATPWSWVSCCKGWINGDLFMCHMSNIL